MAVYIAMTIVSAGFAYLSSWMGGFDLFGKKVREARSNKLQAVYAVLSGLVVYLVMALRYDIGTDYSMVYVPAFYQYQNGGTVQRFEPIFRIINKLSATFFERPQIVFIISSILIVVPLWIAIFKLSPMPWFSIVLFSIGRHFFIALNGMRQYAGFAFVLLAFTFIPKKQFIPYVLCIIVAGMCHYSTLLFLPLFFLVYFRVKPTQSLVFLGLSALITPSFRNMTRWLMSQIPQYSHYLGSKYDLPDRYNQWTLLEQIFVLVIIYLIIESNPIKPEERLLQFLFNLNIVSIWFAFNINLIPLGERISWALEFPTILLIPLCIKRVSRNERRWISVLGITVVYIFVMYCRIVIMNDHRILPYRFFWLFDEGLFG